MLRQLPLKSILFVSYQSAAAVRGQTEGQEDVKQFQAHHFVWVELFYQQILSLYEEQKDKYDFVVTM